jgi:predicted nucleotidyltransferase
VWLSGRLQALLDSAATTGKLRRAFVWGSFVPGKAAPKDIDILLIMDDDFEVDSVAAQGQAVFDSVRGQIAIRVRRLLGSIFYWSRIARSLAGNLLNLKKLSKTRDCGWS